MTSIDMLIERCVSAAEFPEQTAIDATNGKKIIGCVPYYLPFEMVDAAGMYPLELWGGGTNTADASRYYPAFYCSVAVTIMQKALDHTYDFLSGVIVPTTCDALRNLEENWKYSPSEVPVFDFVQPVNRNVPAAEDYYLKQLHRMKEWLEEIGGNEITDKALRESILRYRALNEGVRTFIELANDHLDVITPLARQSIIRAMRILPVEDATATILELNEALKALPVCDFDGLKIMVTGIIMDSSKMLKALEDHGIAIVADDMPSASKRFEVDVPDNVNPFVSIARTWPAIEGSCMLFDPEKKRVQATIDTVARTGADGVLVYMLKFCEEDEFDYPILKRKLEEANIPILYIECEQQSSMDQQAITRIQSFAEALQ